MSEQVKRYAAHLDLISLFDPNELEEDEIVVVQAADFDVLAQRCRGLEAENVRQAEQFKDWQASHHANYVAAAEQRDTLRDEVEALRKTIAEIYAQVDGNISETVRDCVNGIGNVQDIYGYCDRIEEIIAAAMAEKEPACAATAGATPEA